VPFGVDAHELDELSNSALDLLRQRRFDEALLACDRLLREYPQVHDGFERSALIHDALGNHATAAEFWHKTVDFVEHPQRRDDYDQALIDEYRLNLAQSRQRAQHAAEAQHARVADHDRTP
jgi:tetratricopeptide (TPR) repeat protein